MERRRRLWLSLFALPLAFLIFLAVLGNIPTALRWDLTEAKLYTLSAGSKTLMASLEKDVRVVVYFSEQASEDVPSLGFYAERVNDLLAELQRHSDKKMVVEWKDPIPFSSAEDEAILAGLSSLPVGPRGDPIYFGLVAEALEGSGSSIEFLSPNREDLLEYDLVVAIQQAIQDRQPRIALISGLPIQSWVIYEQLQQRHDVIEVPASAQALPSEIDLILMIQPSEMQQELVDAVLQQIDKQIPIVAMVDPLIQSLPEHVAPDEGMEEILASLGVGIDQGLFVADARLGLQVTLEAGAQAIRHPAILGVTGPYLDRQDVITSKLDAINVASIGVVTLKDPSSEWITPLWMSSSQSEVLPVTRLLVDQSVESITAQMLAELPSDGAGHVLAVRVQKPANAIVIADVDFLSDRYWVSRENLLGTQWLDRFASNGGFVLNAIDNLIGDPSLIGLRSREVAFRPFDVVDDLRRLAESRLLATEQSLEAALAEANEKLATLQSNGVEALTEAQQQELTDFISERAMLRQELRSVRRNLDLEIDRLGERLTWINILLMPILVLVFYAGYRWHRATKNWARQIGS